MDFHLISQITVPGGKHGPNSPSGQVLDDKLRCTAGRSGGGRGSRMQAVGSQGHCREGRRQALCPKGSREGGGVNKTHGRRPTGPSKAPCSSFS